MTVDSIGGIWSYATTLARGLRDEGYETLLAVLGPAPSAEQRAGTEARVIDAELPLDWATNDRAASIAAARALARIAADERCDLVHLNSPLLAACADWPAPTLAMAHGCLATWWAATRDEPIDPAYAWQRDLTAQGLRRATIAVAPSEAFARAMRGVYGLTRAIEVIHNGVDPATPPIAPTASARFAFSAGRLWDEAKDAALLDDVAALLTAPLRAAGATNGPSGERFVPRHLDALGALPRHDLATILARRPVFVSTARFEPFGLAVLEAARAGCPLVLSDIATFRELWDDAAVFVRDESARAYADAIDRLLADAAEHSSLGHLARERAGRYSARAMAQATARVYALALATSIAA